MNSLKKVVFTLFIGSLVLLGGCGSLGGGPVYQAGPMPPQVLCNGRYVPQGACGVYGGQQIGIPQYALAGGTFATTVNGRPALCSMKNTAVKTGIGAAIGALVSVLAKDKHMGRDVLIGAAAGAGYAELTCVDASQQTVMQQNGSRLRSEAVCNIRGMEPAYGVSEEECKRLAGEVAAKRVVAHKNPCEDQPERIAVYRANGNLACRKIGTPAEPGERPYIQ